MEKSCPCSTFEEKWARLALHSVGTIQIEPIVLYQSTNACFEQARWAQFVNLSYSNSAVPHEYSGKSGILMSHVFMCLSRDGAEFVSDMEEMWDHASLTYTNDSYYIQSIDLDLYIIGRFCLSVCHEKWSLCPPVSNQVLWRFSWLFMVPGWFFMVPGQFSWFFMVPG